MVKENIGIAIVPSHTIKDEKLKYYDVKGLKRPQIYLSTLNYQTLPKHLEELINIIKKNSSQ